MKSQRGVEGSTGDQGGVLALLAELHPRRFFLETWTQMDAEAREERAARSAAGKGYDFHPLIVLCLGAVCLTAMEYWGGSAELSAVLHWIDPQPDKDSWVFDARYSKWGRFYEFCWWTAWRVLGYLIIPAVSVWMMRERLRDYGLSFKGFWSHAWIYGLSYCVVLVCVVAVSYTEEFSTYYPFYKRSSRSWVDFIGWELLYAAQFFSLEFFFRGYWLKACKTMMGSHAIFAMVVPYCMIHYGKPGLEALGAIIAGVVLGTLAMKTRSIWSGFLIHVSVAISMDTAALLQTAGLPTQWWPN